MLTGSETGFHSLEKLPWQQLVYLPLQLSQDKQRQTLSDLLGTCADMYLISKSSLMYNFRAAPV